MQQFEVTLRITCNSMETVSVAEMREHLGDTIESDIGLITVLDVREV